MKIFLIPHNLSIVYEISQLNKNHLFFTKIIFLDVIMLLGLDANLTHTVKKKISEISSQAVCSRKKIEFNGKILIDLALLTTYVTFNNIS